MPLEPKNEPDLLPAGLGDVFQAARGILARVPGYNPQKYTDHHIMFVLQWVETGDHRKAAVSAGFNPDYGFQLKGDGVLVSLFKSLLRLDMHTEGLRLAYKTLKDVMTDPGAPPPARVQAARTMHDWIEKEEQKTGEAGAKKALADMTMDELANLIGKLEGATQLNASTIDITPDKQ